MTDAFDQARNSGRLAHAWLAVGPAAAGGDLWARRKAAGLLGLAADALDDPDAAHPDFRSLAPPAPDRDIPIDAVRGVVGFLRMTAQGPWKAAVISQADQLNRNAANALLKALEEPPARTTLFLIASAPGRLPITIRSRCRRIRLDAAGESGAAQLAALRPDAAPDVVDAALGAARGDASLAAALIDADLADLPGALSDLEAMDPPRNEGAALTLAARIGAAGEAGRRGLIAAADAAVATAARSGAGAPQSRLALERRDAAVAILDSQRRANLDLKRCAADALFILAGLAEPTP